MILKFFTHRQIIWPNTILHILLPLRNLWSTSRIYNNNGHWSWSWSWGEDISFGKIPYYRYWWSSRVRGVWRWTFPKRTGNFITTLPMSLLYHSYTQSQLAPNVPNLWGMFEKYTR